MNHDDTDRAVAEQQTAGMTRIVIDRRGRILGGTVVSPRAGETLAELTLAVQDGLTTSDLAGVTHDYPTYNDAAIDHTWARLDSPVAGAVVKALLSVNRWRARQHGR